MDAPILLPSVDALLDPTTLPGLLGRAPARVVPLGARGRSGSRFYEVLAGPEGDEARFVVKETRLAEHWLSSRTADDVGREAAALTTAELKPIHRIFASPYRAVAVEQGRTGILMEDVKPGLLDEQREPIAPAVEAAILDTLAELHAAFWESGKLPRLRWLLNAEGFLRVMGPRGHDDQDRTGDDIRAGWREALEQLPEPARTAVQWPAQGIWTSWPELPETLVHGNASLANFATMPDGRIAALDWALTGRAPCTFDIGWYLAANADRLATTGEDALAAYRIALEGRRGGAMTDAAWSLMEEAGIVCGALMLLWSKATDLVAGRDGAAEEWGWWVDRLQRWAGRVV